MGVSTKTNMNDIKIKKFINFVILIGFLSSLIVIIFDSIEHRFDFRYLFNHLKSDYDDFPYNYLYADGFQFLASIYRLYIYFDSYDNFA